MHVFSALLGGYGLKGGNLLFYPRTLTLGAPEFLLAVFGNRNCYGERLVALLTHEFIYGHGKPLLADDTHQYYFFINNTFYCQYCQSILHCSKCKS
jgi:hypothetical protein